MLRALRTLGRGGVQTKGTAVLSAVSGLIVLAIPKCPLCLAAHSVIFTTLGFTAADLPWIEGFFAGLCLISAIFVVRHWFRRPCGRCIETAEPKRPMEKSGITSRAPFSSGV